MIPRAFVALERLPMLPFGKVDMSALPAPESARPPLATPFVPPGTPLEQTLARIWREILGREPIGIHDNFFELGGHSLAAAQLAGRVRQELQVDLAVRTVFEAPTVAALAAHIPADGQVPLDPAALERAIHLLGPV
jgi:acyl carrier protein